MSISTGHDSSYLTGSVGAGRESYYLDATTSGEPPGRWSGAGAEAFGLTGEVDPEVMAALYSDLFDPRDPQFADPATRSECVRLGRTPQKAKDVEAVLAERIKAYPGTPLPEEVRRMRHDLQRQIGRGGVMYLDLTYSPQKSVTVLHTAFHRAELEALREGNATDAAVWAQRREAVESAVWAGNAAMLGYANQAAGYSRADASNTATRWVEGKAWTIASFFQHTSRALDPQLHIHNAVLNRVVCEDGKARTLDSRSIHKIKQAAGSIGDRTMEEALTSSLGVTWRMRADGVGRELVGVDKEVMDLFSTRSKTLSAKAAELVALAEQRRGRPLVAVEIDWIRRQASMATRAAKTHDGETTEQMLDRWDAQSRSEFAGGLGRIAERFRVNGAAVSADDWSPEAVVSQAVAACQLSRAAWSRSELIRQTFVALGDTHLGGLDGEEIRALAESLADHVLETELVVQVSGADLDVPVPESLRLENGRSVYEAPNSARYAAASHLMAEEALRRSAVVRGCTTAPAEVAEAWLRERAEQFGLDQAAAIRGITTSDAALTVLVGPAGTGKSHTAGAINAVWTHATGGRVIGLAVSEVATEVLRDDGIPVSLNTSKFLAAHDRLAQGLRNPEDLYWALGPNDLVMIDEASMVSTEQLSRIRDIAAAGGARVCWTGDPEQLGSVDAGGMMALLAGGEAETYTLAEVRRFNAAWERDASLRLRDGDTEVLAEYDRHGRVLDSGTLAQAGQAAARAYVADRVQDLSSIVVVGSNEHAAELSTQIRNQLVELGLVQAEGLILGRDNTTAGVGDIVACRRNDYGIGVTNRRQYTIDAINDDGSLTVRPLAGGAAIRLPAAYVAADTTLAYAGTVHAAQGLTVDRSHLVAGEGTTREALYVGASRGKDGNWVYTVTVAEDTDGREAERRPPIAVLADAVEASTDLGDSATAILQQDEAARSSERTIQGRIEDAVRVSTRARTERMLDSLTAEGALSNSDRARLGADTGTEYLSRVLRRAEQAGLDPAQILRTAVSDPRGLGEATSTAQILSARITSTQNLTPNSDLASAVPGDIPADHFAYLEALRELADDRRHALGTQTAQEAPAWAVAALGPIPEDLLARQDWEQRAGLVAAHREATGWDDDTAPIGGPPALSSTEERAAWYGAWIAVGRPEAHIEEADLTDGALRLRVTAYRRELANAPEYVDDALRTASMTATTAQQDAHLSTAAGNRHEATAAADMAQTAQQVSNYLSAAAQGRDAWLAHTIVMREAHDRALDEMDRRGLAPYGHEPDRTNAEDWFAAEAAVRTADDEHRTITETDLINPDDHTPPVTAPSPATVEDTSAQTATTAPAVMNPAEAELLAVRARLTLDVIADRESEEASLRESEATQAAHTHDVIRKREQAAEHADVTDYA